MPFDVLSVILFTHLSLIPSLYLIGFVICFTLMDHGSCSTPRPMTPMSRRLCCRPIGRWCTPNLNVETMMGVEKRSFAYHLDLAIRFIRRTCLYRWQEYLSSYLLAELRTFWAMNVCERHSTELATRRNRRSYWPIGNIYGSNISFSPYGTRQKTMQRTKKKKGCISEKKCISRESNPELGHGKTQCYRYTTNAC